MKIAIVTLPLHTNYGGILQAYALQTVLQQMGHEVHHLQPLVEFTSLHPTWQMPFVWIKRLIRKYLLGERQLPIVEHPHRWMRKYTDAFIHKYISMHFLQDEEWNTSLEKEYDAFIVGSDQVWRSCYACPIERYFLSFLGYACTKPRIAYAASFGTKDCDFTSNQIFNCRELLQKFSFVSVREESGVDICRQQFDTNACQLIDPTLLLLKNEYLNLIHEVHPSKGDLMVYILDETIATKHLINQIANSEGLIPFYTYSKIENYQAKGADFQQPPVEQWLKGFIDAKLVVTDSFHACVFAIIFNKPFICIGNNKRGMARFQSLLDLFGLQQCLINIEQLYEIPNINWEKKGMKLEKLRKHSLFSLEQALIN